MIVNRNREAETLEKWYHILSWGMPALAVIAVAAANLYGNLGGAICYITNGYAVFFAFFVPGLVIISANSVIFFFISREIHETLASAPQISEKKEKKREFRVYISILISIGLSWIFGFIMSLFPSNSIGAIIFDILFSITTPLQGFLIFGSYCLNYKVLSKWAGLLRKYIPFCAKLEHLGSSRSTGSRV